MDLSTENVEVTQPEIVDEPVEQVTQPAESKEVKQEETKSFTQSQLDEMIEKRLFRQRETISKEKETELNNLKASYEDKLKSYESDHKALAESLQEKELELTRVRYGIKEEKYEEARVLQEFKMSKDSSLTADEALKLVLDERPDYKESTVKQVGIEITKDTVDAKPLYSDELLKMYPWLAN